MIPTNLDALNGSELLSASGQGRLADELDIPAEPPNGDESIAAFVSRRLGREAYDNLVEPLMTGIYGGDGEQLSLQATFPNLRALEVEHGSLVRGLQAQSADQGSRFPPFLTLRPGMESLVRALVDRFERTGLVTGRTVTRLSRSSRWIRGRARRRSDDRTPPESWSHCRRSSRPRSWWTSTPSSLRPMPRSPMHRRRS